PRSRAPSVTRSSRSSAWSAASLPEGSSPQAGRATQAGRACRDLVPSGWSSRSSWSSLSRPLANRPAPTKNTASPGDGVFVVKTWCLQGADLLGDRRLLVGGLVLVNDALAGGLVELLRGEEEGSCGLFLVSGCDSGTGGANRGAKLSLVCLVAIRRLL